MVNLTCRPYCSFQTHLVVILLILKEWMVWAQWAFVKSGGDLTQIYLSNRLITELFTVSVIIFLFFFFWENFFYGINFAFCRSQIWALGSFVRKLRFKYFYTYSSDTTFVKNSLINGLNFVLLVLCLHLDIKAIETLITIQIVFSVPYIFILVVIYVYDLCSLCCNNVFSLLLAISNAVILTITSLYMFFFRIYYSFIIFITFVFLSVRRS